MSPSQNLRLLPQPRQIRFVGPSCPVVTTETKVVLDPQCGLPAQGYRLSVGADGVRIVGRDEAGVFYGRMTLRQIVRQCPKELPAVEIEDWPDFPRRGVMLDISRDKVPTMETLRALVDEFSEWKINELQLYIEHTFAYGNHREVWANASPMTAEQIRQLDAYCRERFIELVPNQQTLAHLERWFRHPSYRPLAECPDGFINPWGSWNDAFSLEPGAPRSLALIAEWLDELLPNFTSRRINVNGDEPWDIGKGKSQERVAKLGYGPVYLDHLLQVRELCRARGFTMHFWTDIILTHPELIPQLPKDLVALIWGYDADYPFDTNAGKVAASGLSFLVCPGTSSWQSIAGRTDNCLANLHNAAMSGRKHGAIGFLNTDWGDFGHWQYLPVSYLGFSAGAALSWCRQSNEGADWPAVLDAQVFRDEAGIMGRLAYDLGNAYRHAGAPTSNVSVLFDLIHKPAGHNVFQKISREALAETRDFIHSIMVPLGQARMQRPDATLIQTEFANAARMLRHGCDRASGVAPNELAADMRAIVAEHRRLWLARNRPGGLDDSCRGLEQRQHEYEEKA